MARGFAPCRLGVGLWPTERHCIYGHRTSNLVPEQVWFFASEINGVPRLEARE